MAKRTKLFCAMCKKPITKRTSHPAEPVAQGLCCTDCYDNIVIQLRVAMMVRAAANEED